jgi:hypothetical protein
VQLSGKNNASTTFNSFVDIGTVEIPSEDELAAEEFAWWITPSADGHGCTRNNVSTERIYSLVR